jgi:hypothetical protein
VTWGSGAESAPLSARTQGRTGGGAYHVKVNGETALSVDDGHVRRHEMAPVAALGHVPLVAQGLHQADHQVGHLLHVVARGQRRV